MLQISPSVEAVPVICNNRVIGDMTQEQLNLHGTGGLILVRNRKGYIREVIVRPSMYTSSKGDAFEQALGTGHVWALTGVTGS